MTSRLPRFSFDDVSLERIHSWLHLGDNGDSIERAGQSVRGLVDDLEASQERLAAVLAELCEWEGEAGDGAAGATRLMEAWAAAAKPVVDATSTAAGEFVAAFVETRSRTPSPDEAELTSTEQVIAQIPLGGAVISKRLADERRDQLTQEARQRMYDYQERAFAAEAGAAPLPDLPSPVIEVDEAGAGPLTSVNDPGRTGQDEVRDGTPAQPPSPTPPGATPPAVPVHPPGWPGTPSTPAPTLPAPTPPASPGPGAPGGPVVPLPPGGSAGPGTGGGNPGAGRGLLAREEPGRGRGNPSGQPGQPGRGAVGGAPGGSTTTTGRPTSAGQPGSGRGGGIMQPAVGAGRGAGNDDDAEHRDKYAARSDDYIVGDIPKVAPPVIGARPERHT